MKTRLLAFLSIAWIASSPACWRAGAADVHPGVQAAPQPAPNPEIFVGGAHMPDRERELIAIFGDAARRYEAARTALQRSDIRISTELRISRYMAASQDAPDWVGVFKGARSTPEGDLWLSIEIAPNVTLTTHQNRFADETEQTLIHRFSPMWPVLDQLLVGEVVTFHAFMLSMDVADNDEMMLRPRLIARFSAIKQIE